MTDPMMVTAVEVADMLHVHVNTVKRIPAADLPYYRIGNRGDRRYLIRDVQSYLALRKAPALTPER